MLKTRIEEGGGNHLQMAQLNSYSCLTDSGANLSRPGSDVKLAQGLAVRIVIHRRGADHVSVRDYYSIFLSVS